MDVELPASVALLLDEFRGRTLTLELVQKRMRDKGFRRALFDQSSHAIAAFPYADRQPPRLDKFDLYAGDGLDPFSPQGKCHHPACRLNYVHQFARTACLYADRVVLPDPVSFGQFLDISETDAFMTIAMLRTLRPLLAVGVVQFGPAAYTSCKACGKAVAVAKKDVARELWRTFKERPWDVFRFKYGRRWHISFGSPLLRADGEEFRLIFPATKAAIHASKPGVLVRNGAARKLLLDDYRPGLRAYFAHVAHAVVFSAHMGAICGKTVATNVRQAAVGYRALDGRGASSSGEWALLRTIRLPALARLSTSQALAVRGEAERALPAFRAKLQRDLLSLSNASEEQEQVRTLEIAAELREAARELQGRLASVRIPSVRRNESLFASLAIALEIVALGSGNPTLILGSSGALMSLLLAAHRGQRDSQEKHELLLHHPAYVLLAAERQHAGH